ncbi:MAG TPA: NAD(P)-binding protein [Chloroflexota bacterium]|nr:NAD(P)-binding protein [Chloroflexota bacterium]
MNKPFAITLEVGTSRANHTGAWRTSRPVYLDRLPPCNQGCPAGENIQAWLSHAEEGNYQAAWEEIVRNNPLPAIMGRVCYHPCESVCNRAKLDSAVNIHSVERFLGDLAIKEGWRVTVQAPASGKKVLVIGSGPSGLSAAYHLARLGHTVIIMEAEDEAGGMMRYGIPTYRLPRAVLDAEIGRILDLGVALQLNAKVENIPETMARGGFDACFVAIGAHLAKRVRIPTPDAGRILDALSMLHAVETGDEPLQLGRQVVVYGGGNTALDAARTAKRLGHEAVIVYRRTRERMPAHDFEVREALEEGVTMRWLSTITELGEVGITVERMELDESSWPQPTGEVETIAGDSLVLALGQDVDTTVLERIPGVQPAKDGVVTVDSTMMTGYPGIFAGGDMVPAERTVTVAVGHGKKAARCIDAYLRASTYQIPPKHEVASFEKLNTWYYSDADKTVQPALDLVRRQTTFEEVVGGLDQTNALFEARRCLSCGNCFECDNCFGVCPDNAVIKLGPGKRFAFNLDFCKGCGMCEQECPCGAIAMVPEEI